MARKLELLAPAREAEIAREAILHGADAIYIGGPSHGARASAGNSVESIASLTEMAHIYGVKVYVTLNTIIYDEELRAVEHTIHDLYDAGVDALIVQDMGILRMDIPPIDLHASTQCDIRTPQKARFLVECGFSQLVLPRELSLDEIRQIRAAVPADVALEAFVHGALCVSYSGDCQASCVAMGRSANRGECAQMCRLPYNLTDSQGRVIVADKHLLSLRDLNRLADLDALVDAGISSFKIEGRLKDAAYVKNTVAAYSQALDRVIASHGDEYMRSAQGRTSLTFAPDVEKAFNRGFTSYFISGRPFEGVKMASIDTPKWTGPSVGTVVVNNGKSLIVKLSETLNNGDGLGYFDREGRFTGFHLNRIEGNRLYPARPIDVAAGAALYRNRDIKAEAALMKKTADRKIPIEMSLTLDGNMLVLEVSDQTSTRVKATVEIAPEPSQTPQAEARRRALSKLGNTPYTLERLTDLVDSNIFIAASVVTALRQKTIDLFTEAKLDEYQRNARREENADAVYPSTELTYHDNVANRLARQFYTDHGVESIQEALETKSAKSLKDKPLTVMTTRYCIRRELGACLKTKDGTRLPSPLYLTTDAATYQLDFDCKNCQMHLLTASNHLAVKK